ncbi:DUF7344 domain-containing protein [Halorussus salinisoli]|uniref:DUF7344 domain-containing protein n=1 Tax=Halorussus salinisoli TaxID=2558242 RepID=UPI002A918947|nr:hypothetical protein [Halorussus salinisoli]
MSENPSEAKSETGGNATGVPTPEPAPTADLHTGEEPSEKLDAAFELLAEPLRRDALYHLADEESVGLDSLAEDIAAKLDDETDAQSLTVELHHVHLPKLESHGVVAYDPERGTVRYRSRAWLDEWLEHVRREESD